MVSNFLESTAKDYNLIKKLTIDELNELSKEIRSKIIETTSNNGGHLASNLGCVELTLALFKVFNIPNDKIVWDVGHQCYTYKMLTGRYDNFDSLRTEGGISGFPKEYESKFDSFISGHASTSLAVAYGLKKSMSLKKINNTVITVTGDGSFTGGMVYEGLNNIGKSKEHIIVILNDNNMAISKNDGAISKYFSKIRSGKKYFDFKYNTKRIIKGIPLVGKGIYLFLSGSKRFFKRLIYPQTFFEEFGFKYFGPVDGHDIEALSTVLEAANKYDGPSLVHVNTIKGKGYSFAENNPEKFHGVSQFNINTGESLLNSKETYSSVFGNELVKLAKKDKNIVAITAAMEDGTGLSQFSKLFKNEGRFFDVGIAEEFAMTFASAFTSNDIVPIFCVYSTFLQRSYDQILHDACIENKHVILAIDRAGVVGDDGETHQGIFDTSFLCSIPNLTIFSPATYEELKLDLNKAIYEYNSPVAIRYPRGSQDFDFISNSSDFYYENNENNTLMITYGREFFEVFKAHQVNNNFDILKLNKIYPFKEELFDIAKKYKNIIFVEEAYINSSVGANFLSELLVKGFIGKARHIAFNNFVPQSLLASALKNNNMDKDGILKILDEDK